MKVVFSREPLLKEESSLFLAGPTPRSSTVSSWRPQALDILKEKKFSGLVFVPEDRNHEGSSPSVVFDYPEQIAWERKALKQSGVVIFWIPRDLKDMPAFTTNIEYGFISERGQPHVLGYPKEAPKMRYLDWVAQEKGVPIRHTLQDTIETAISMLENKQ